MENPEGRQIITNNWKHCSINTKKKNTGPNLKEKCVTDSPGILGKSDTTMGFNSETNILNS